MKKIAVLPILVLLSFTISCEEINAYRYQRKVQKIYELSSQGKYIEAEKAANDAYDFAVKHFGKDDEYLSASLRNLSKVYISSGKPEKAEPFLLRAVEIERKIGNKHRGLAFALQDLSLVYGHKQMYAQAIKNRRESIMIFESLYGKDDDYFVKQSLIILADLYKQNGEIEQAKQIHTRLYRNN